MGSCLIFKLTLMVRARGLEIFTNNKGLRSANTDWAINIIKARQSSLKYIQETTQNFNYKQDNYITIKITIAWKFTKASTLKVTQQS